MSIVFKTIRWKNFLSTGDNFTEIDFLKSPKTLIVGENGAGKSTMLDALNYVLFNKPHRNINKPQLINSINEKGLVVEIEFTIGRNEYKVIRGHKPGIFEIYHNGTSSTKRLRFETIKSTLNRPSYVLTISHSTRWLSLDRHRLFHLCSYLLARDVRSSRIYLT